jgi:hypothetical protein
MPIPERLSVWAYDPLSGAVTNYGDTIEQLRSTALTGASIGTGFLASVPQGHPRANRCGA